MKFIFLGQTIEVKDRDEFPLQWIGDNGEVKEYMIRARTHGAHMFARIVEIKKRFRSRRFPAEK